MKLYIPSLGDEIKLTKDWTFDLWNESRNSTLKEFVGDTRPECRYAHLMIHEDAIKAIIPAGEILKIDRIYIRQGSEEFDSITFLWKGKKTGSKIETRIARRLAPNLNEEIPYEKKVPGRAVRFWVKLADANNIEFEQVLAPK